jgi:hypothetical protein
VFVERTQRHAERIKVETAVLLGHMMAHERGHLLLGEGAHSASGIMTARFKVRRLQSAGQGGTRFFKRQREALQAQIARRLVLRLEQMAAL